MAKNKTRTNPAPWLMMGLGSLLILGAVIWATLNVLAEPVQPTASAESYSNANPPYPGVERISLEAAKLAYDEGTAIFVDVRDPEYYEPGHVTGALNIPYGEVESYLSGLDPNRQYILYCT